MASFMWVISTFLFVLFDVAYFVRGIIAAVFAKVMFNMSPRKPLEESSVLGICLTTDMDFMWHMNNARYLRECDFARVDLWLRNGIYNTVSRLGGGITLGGSTIRYRKSLQILDVYNIKTRILCWDDKSFFVEQQIVRYNDDFVCAVVLARQSLLRLTPAQVLFELTGEHMASPEFPEEVKAWDSYNKLSSEKLKKEL